MVGPIYLLINQYKRFSRQLRNEPNIRSWNCTVRCSSRYFFRTPVQDSQCPVADARGLFCSFTVHAPRSTIHDSCFSSSSARWIVWTLVPCRWRAPPMFIKQPVSVLTTMSASVSSTQETLSATIAPEILG